MGYDKKELMFLMISRDSLGNPNGFKMSERYLIDLSKGEIFDKKEKQNLPYDLDNKIKVYEDRQKTWFFDIADSLKNNSEAEFIILMIAVSYLESNQKFRNGNERDGSSQRIRDSLQRIIPTITPKIRDKFVGGVRNGLFHDGMTKKGIFVGNNNSDVFSSNVLNQTGLVVDSIKLLELVKRDFEKYITELKDQSYITLRNNFEAMWNFQKGI